MVCDAGLHTDSVFVLSQMGLMEPGLCVPRCKCLLAMVHNARYESMELRAGSLRRSNPSPLNAEKMLIVASTRTEQLRIYIGMLNGGSVH